MELSNQMVEILVGLVLPLVVGLVTKYSASRKLKVVAGILVAGIAATLLEAATEGGGALLTEEHLWSFVRVYGAQIAAYLGVYGPLDANESLAPRFGLGKEAVIRVRAEG